MKNNFYRKKLKNGMTIVLEKRKSPAVSIAFAVRFGGINEGVSEKGIAHFIEHMLYKGTSKRNSKKIAEEIEKNGGYLNGFTGETTTAYHCKMPLKHFDIGFDVLSDMVKNPLFDEKEIEKEKKVIFEEINMHNDNPINYVIQEIHSSLYEKPFGLPHIGNKKTLGSLNKEKLFQYFQEVYQPNNIILCVVGDVSIEKLVELVDKNFSDKKGKVKKFLITKKNKVGFGKRKGIGQANMVFGYHVPIFSNKNCYAAFILDTITTGGLSSRLFQEIREKRNLAYAIKGGSEINLDFAYNFIYVGAEKRNVKKIKELILEEFKKISKTLSEEELLQVKEQIIGNHNIFSEDSQSQMMNLLSYEINGNAKEFYNFEKRILDVKLNDVKKIAEIPLKKHSFFALIPQ